MESCLLCLDTESKMIGCITVDSLQWKTANVKYIIEKHLWTMNSINTSDWLCMNCWSILDNFHKYYFRIKEAHDTLRSISKTSGIQDRIKNENSIFKELKSSVDCNEYIESNIETVVLVEQDAFTKCEIENPLIKNEYSENCIDDKPPKQRRKRGRPPKDIVRDLIHRNKDPLERKNKAKTFIRDKKTKETSISLDTIEKKEPLKNEMATEELTDDTNISDADTVYEYCDIKTSSETFKKKRKNPDDKTLQDYDKIIAEYFKIFCSLCQIPIDNFIALRKHFREEHKKRGFVICCKKKIFTRPILVDHIRFHLDPNFFKCKLCDKIYSDRCTLESHLKIHEDGQQDRNRVCDMCGKSFVGSTQLEAHKKTHDPNYEKKFSCSECKKFFTTLYSLNYHIQAIHHNKYVKICDICGKTMRCRNSFKLHMEKHDNKIASPIYCDICGLRLVDRRGLRRHKNSQHPVGGKKEYSCHICSKISPNLRALRTHIRFAHETGYIHKCTLCEKAFKRSEALKEHMATHTGTPLYTCPWCPKTFISNGNMHNHRKKSHPKEWEEAQRQKYGGIFSSSCNPTIPQTQT